jgi:hypothetical protein
MEKRNNDTFDFITDDGECMAKESMRKIPASAEMF